MRKFDAGEKGAPQIQNGVRFSGLGNWVDEAKTGRQKKKKESKKQSCDQRPTQLSDSKAAAAHGSSHRKNDKKNNHVFCSFMNTSAAHQWLYFFFYFTILYWFCHTSTWIHHGCTRVPHPEPPSHLPPHIIPLGHPSASALSILYPASKLDCSPTVLHWVFFKRNHLYNGVRLESF